MPGQSQASGTIFWTLLREVLIPAIQFILSILNLPLFFSFRFSNFRSVASKVRPPLKLAAASDRRKTNVRLTVTFARLVSHPKGVTLDEM